MSTRIAGLMLCDDLIFTSKVTGTAKALGYSVRAARTPELLVELARQHPPRCVIVDLDLPALDVALLLRQLTEVNPRRPRIVGYGSHVEAARLHAARVAGCDPVWPRSKFVEELHDALRVWLADSPPRTDKQEETTLYT